jgi:broad specificity phosphatase PhoE
VARTVELRRHTANDGDVLTDDGVEAAMTIGRGMSGSYDVMVSSGRQRATQTIACLLAASGLQVARGIVVDERFRSEYEDRWYKAYEQTGAGDLDSFKSADPELVEMEARSFGQALRSLFESLPDGGRALVVGHSPTQEVAVLGLTGEAPSPLGKGEGVAVVREDNGSFRVEDLD